LADNAEGIISQNAGVLQEFNLILGYAIRSPREADIPSGNPRAIDF